MRRRQRRLRQFLRHGHLSVAMAPAEVQGNRRQAQSTSLWTMMRRCLRPGVGRQHSWRCGRRGEMRGDQTTTVRTSRQRRAWWTSPMTLFSTFQLSSGSRRRRSWRREKEMTAAWVKRKEEDGERKRRKLEMALMRSVDKGERLRGSAATSFSNPSASSSGAGSRGACGADRGRASVADYGWAHEGIRAGCGCATATDHGKSVTYHRKADR